MFTSSGQILISTWKQLGSAFSCCIPGLDAAGHKFKASHQWKTSGSLGLHVVARKVLANVHGSCSVSARHGEPLSIDCLVHLLSCSLWLWPENNTPDRHLAPMHLGYLCVSLTNACARLWSKIKPGATYRAADNAHKAQQAMQSWSAPAAQFHAYSI